MPAHPFSYYWLGRDLSVFMIAAVMIRRFRNKRSVADLWRKVFKELRSTMGMMMEDVLLSLDLIDPIDGVNVGHDGLQLIEIMYSEGDGGGDDVVDGVGVDSVDV